MWDGSPCWHSPRFTTPLLMHREPKISYLLLLVRVGEWVASFPLLQDFFLQDFLQESFLTWVRFHRTLLEKARPEDNLVRSCPRWAADWISLWVTGSFHSRSRTSQWYLSPVQHFGFQLSQTHVRFNLALHMPVQLSVPCLRKCKSRVTAEPREGDHAWENSCSAERHTRGF